MLVSILMPCLETAGWIAKGLRLLTLPLLLCLLPRLVAAEGANSPESATSRGAVASLSGSERLRMFAWGKWLETGSPPQTVVDAMRGTLVQNGFYHDAAVPAVVRSNVYLAPQLSYETNVNGGVAQDSFAAGGFIFDVDPAYRAVSGLVIGVNGSAETRVAWMNGHTINTTAEGFVGWAPESDIGYRRGSIEICSQNNLVRWLFFDGCILHAANDRILSSSSIDQTSFKLSSLFQTASVYHELTSEIAKTETQDYSQTTATIALNSVWNDLVTGLSITFGEPNAEQTVLDRRVAIDVRWEAGGHPIGLGVWTATSRGGTFLGVDQVDDAIGVNVSVQARRGLSIEAGYAQTVSTAALYNDQSVSLQFQFDGFSF